MAGSSNGRFVPLVPKMEAEDEHETTEIKPACMEEYNPRRIEIQSEGDDVLESVMTEMLVETPCFHESQIVYEEHYPPPPNHNTTQDMKVHELIERMFSGSYQVNESQYEAQDEESWRVENVTEEGMEQESEGDEDGDGRHVEKRVPKLVFKRSMMRKMLDEGEERASEQMNVSVSVSEDRQNRLSSIDRMHEDEPQAEHVHADEIEWDFDVMMRNKKQAKRGRKKNGDVDFISDNDGMIQRMVEKMNKAARDDRVANIEMKPALSKIKLMPDVKNLLIKCDMVTAMVENGMLSAIAEWLAPLPDKSLPSLNIRSQLLKALVGFGKLDTNSLKTSGIGKAVMLLKKHPRETKENKATAGWLIQEWARIVFQLSDDLTSTREEREEIDRVHFEEEVNRRKPNVCSTSSRYQPYIPSPLVTSNSQRAHIPRKSTTVYVKRPQSTVHCEFKSYKSSSRAARSPMERATLEIKAKLAEKKPQRTVNVSIFE